MAVVKKETKDLVVARTSFYLGEEIGMVKRGDVFAADSDVVRKYPEAFTPAEDRMRIR